jgi:hypothetical protein
MSPAPKKLRKYVNGKTSPGMETKVPSPIRKAATWVLMLVATVLPGGGGGTGIVQVGS